MVFSIFIEFCNNHHDLIQNIFIIPPKKLYPLAVTPHFPQAQPLGVTNLPSVSGFAGSGHFIETEPGNTWPLVSGLFHLSVFVLICSRCSMNQYFLPFSGQILFHRVAIPHVHVLFIHRLESIRVVCTRGYWECRCRERSAQAGVRAFSLLSSRHRAGNCCLWRNSWFNLLKNGFPQRP